MDRNDNHDAEITLDLSKLLGFQGLDLQGDEAELTETMGAAHNKIGEVGPRSPDRNA